MQSEEEKQKAEESQEQQDPVSNQQTSIAHKMLHCPECKSSLIRKRIGPTLVLISVAVFGILLLLRVFVLVLRLEQLQATSKLSFPLSILAICVTTCIALFGKYRCLSCGHRFRSMFKAKRRWMGPFFLRRFVIINAALIIIFCVSSEMLELIYNCALPIVIPRVIFALIGSSFWILMSLAYQVLLYEILKKRIRHNLIWAILFILPSIMLGISLFYVSLPTVNARRILTLAELAPLPESATEIKVYEWSFIFSGEKYSRFRASPSDIEKFLKKSPILQDVECEKFPADGIRARSQNPNAPDWYKEDIKKGRLYITHPEWGYYPGQVIVDDEEHFVYVNIIWS